MILRRCLYLYVSLLVALPASSPALAQELRDVSRYIENPGRVAENQEPTHVPLVPFPSVSLAREADWSRSPYYQLLDGHWSFKWVSNPQQVPTGFDADGFDASAWDSIRVPGSWQAQGYGHAMYRNAVQALHPYDPPYVPDEQNGTGLYRRTFTVPDGWTGRQVFVHFEGVKSASFVWVNGEYVGYDQGGMTPAEYNITPYVRSGKNTIAVEVIRWSDGSYLEDWDMWRFSGMYRSVYLFSTPPVHIQDFFVRTDLDDAYRDAALMVDAKVQNYTKQRGGQYVVRAELFDASGASVAQFEKPVRVGTQEAVSARLHRPIRTPRKWSAEKPYLYTLTLELVAPGGQVTEVLSEQVGFRKLEIRDGQALINGVPVMFKGVNRPEHSPDLGRAMTPEIMEQDVALLKQFNVNAVRLSHYPSDPAWYHLADEYGLYLQDEVNAECHHATRIPEEMWPYGKRLTDVTGWQAAFSDRFRRMVERDKNHPSVVMWSTGNECGLGRAHFKMADYARAHDDSRFLMHQASRYRIEAFGTAPYVDIDGPRYLSPEELRAEGRGGRRPLVMGEYAHAHGNGLGHFDELWDVIYKYRRLQGGFVWDWADQGLRQKRITTPNAGPHPIDATLVGRPEIVHGKRGQALSLSGLDDWVEVYNHPALDLTDSTLTLAAWVHPHGWNGSLNAYVAKGNKYGLARTGKRTLEFYVYDGRRVAVEARTPGDWDYNWHHIAGVYDGDSLRLLIDGERTGATGHPKNEKSDGQIDRVYYPVNIGRNAQTQRDNFSGWLARATLDEVRIYDRALATDVLARPDDLPSGAVLQLDFDAFERAGNFFTYGISPGLIDGTVFADRTIQPELWQLKRSHAPVRVEPVDLRGGRVRVINRHHFTNLNELEGHWLLEAAGKPLGRGSLTLNLPPGDTTVTTLPVQQFSYEPGVEYWLTVSFTRPEATKGVPKGHEVAFDQFLMPGEEAETISLADMPALKLRRTGGDIVVAGQSFTYVFGRKEGTLQSMTYRGHELIKRGPRMNVWRAPISNELASWGNAEANDWRALGLDRLNHHVRDIEARRLSETEVVIEIKTVARAEDQQVGFDNIYRYHVFGSGDIVLRHQARPVSKDKMPWLAKMGLQMEMPGRFNQLTWYGRGPFETYPDRKTGARVDVYRGTVDEQYVPYLPPQDYGNKTDVRWVALADSSREIGLAAFADSAMNISVTPYRNLDRAVYPYQLQRAGAVTFNLDHRVSGVGEKPIPPLEKHQTRPAAYDYTIRLRPFSLMEDAPVALSRQTPALIWNAN